MARRLAVKAIRVPSGLQAGSPSGVGPLTSDRASPVAGIDEPQVRVAVVDEARAVELVAEPVDVAVVGQRHLAGLRRGGPAALLRLLRDRRPERARDDRQPAPVGRPRELVRAARQVGQPPRLATVERQQEDLVAVEAVLRLLRPVGLLLDQQPAVGDEGERAPVGREARVAVRAAADGDLAGGRRAVGRGHPHRVAVAVVAHRRALDAERDVPRRRARARGRRGRRGGTGRPGARDEARAPPMTRVRVWTAVRGLRGPGSLVLRWSLSPPG